MAAMGIYSSNSRPSATASTSTSTLPSIRSLRKAFQFSSSSSSNINKRHHSVDGYNLPTSAKEDLRRSTGNAGSGLPRPSASFTKGSNVLTKSISASNIHALTGPGTASPSSTPNDVHSNGIKNGPAFQQHLKALPARPLSAHTIPEYHAVIYSSNIPVNSRSSSNSTTTSVRSSPSRSSGLNKQQALKPSSATRTVAGEPTAPIEDAAKRLAATEEKDEDEIMHITQVKGSTPPPLIPLPPVPTLHKNGEVPQAEDHLPLPMKKAWSSTNSNRQSMEIPRNREVSAVSILDEMAPEEFDQEDTMSISSPPPSARPTLSRSRSAIESIKAIAAETDILNVSTSSSDLNIRTRQNSLPKPIIMESPSRSPAVTDANKLFNFPPSLSVENVNLSNGQIVDRSGSPVRNRIGLDTSLGSSSDGLGDSAYLRGARHSSTSPLSELVHRLNTSHGASPIREDCISPIAYTHDMDTADLRSEEDPSEAHFRNNVPTSPFITQSMLDEDDGTSNIEFGSVEGSSGISAAPPSKLPKQVLPQNEAKVEPPNKTFEKLGGRRVSQNSNNTPRSNSGNKTTALQEFEKRISPQTEKRWSMAEVEAAYGRIRKLATRRSSAAVSEAPSFLISEDSKDLAPSYVQHLIDRGFPLDASMMSSSDTHAPSALSNDTSHLDALRTDTSPYEPALNSSTDREEAGDALTPLVGRDRYSPSTSPRVSPRALSPQVFGQFSNKSPRNSFVEHRNDSPQSSGTGSSSRGKSTASGVLTAPTTARHSLESESKLPHTAPRILRSVSDQNDRTTKSQSGSAWLRRASGDARSAASSGAGSDDTGWVTPKTSAGDTMDRRRSVSPALTATRRDSSASAMDHYDETPHHTTSAYHTARRASSTRIRRPVSYSSSGGTDSLPGGQYGRNASYRYAHGPSHSASQSSLWFDDTPKAASKARPSIPTDFRGGMAGHPHRREASSYSTAGSTYSIDSLGTSSFAEAKRADKIDLFLRCTKAESALQAITAHSQIEREALLDALQESRAMIDGLRQQNEELISELEHLRRAGNRKPVEQSQEAARRIAEIVEARDDWQARAQAMERDLAVARHTQQKNAMDSETALATMKQEIARLQEQLTARIPKSLPRTIPRAASGLPRKSPPSGNTLKSSNSHSALPRSIGSTKSSVNGLPRSRHSSGTNSNGFSPHGRTISNTSSTVQTDFGDHLPASSDGWSLGDSQDASLRLDDSTARFLQEIDGPSVGTRQKSTTSSK